MLTLSISPPARTLTNADHTLTYADKFKMNMSATVRVEFATVRDLVGDKMFVLCSSYKKLDLIFPNPPARREMQWKKSAGREPFQEK